MELVKKDGRIYLLDDRLLRAVCLDSLSVQVSADTKIVLDKFYRHVLQNPSNYTRVAEAGESDVRINDFLSSSANKELVKNKLVYVLDATPDSNLIKGVQALAGYMEYEGRFTGATPLPVSVLIPRAEKYAADARFRSKTFRVLDSSPVLISLSGYELRELQTPEQFAFEAKRLGELNGQDYSAKFQAFQNNLSRVFYVSSQGRPVLTLWFDFLGEDPPQTQSYYPNNRDYSNYALVDVDYYPTPDKKSREAYTEAEDMLSPMLDFLSRNTAVKSAYYKVGRTRSGSYQRIDRDPLDSTIVLTKQTVRGLNYQLPLGFVAIMAEELSFYGCPKVMIPALTASAVHVEGCQKFIADTVQADTVNLIGSATGSNYSAKIKARHVTLAQVKADKIEIQSDTLELIDCQKIDVAGDEPKHQSRKLILNTEKLDMAGANSLRTQELRLERGTYTNVNLAEQFPNCSVLVQDHASLRSVTEHKLRKYSVLGYDQGTSTLQGHADHLYVQTLTEIPDVECNALSIEYGGDGHNRLYRTAKFLAFDGHADYLLSDRKHGDLYLFPSTPARLATYIGKSLTADRIVLRLCAPIASLDLVVKLVCNMKGHLTLVGDDPSWFPLGWVDGVIFAVGADRVAVADASNLNMVYRGVVACR